MSQFEEKKSLSTERPDRIGAYYEDYRLESLGYKAGAAGTFIRLLQDRHRRGRIRNRRSDQFGRGGSVIVGNMARFLRDSTASEDFRESLVGEDPQYIDRIWHKLYRRFTGGGGFGGFVTTLLSGIDIALWDKS